MRLYLIFGSLVIFVFFAVYTQILIQNAKREQEYVPRIFAKYIAYSDSYLRQAEQSAQLISELSTNHLKSVAMPDYQSAISDYILYEFMPKNPIPIIITDPNYQPVAWSRVGVAPDSSYSDLAESSRLRLEEQMQRMNNVPIMVDSTVTNYAFYARPTSLQEFIKKIDYSVIVTDRQKTPLFWRNMDVSEAVRWDEMRFADRQKLLSGIRGMSEIPLSNEADSLGFIYFSSPKTLSHIRYIVILELTLAVLLIAFGSYGLWLLRRTEKDTLWIGLAKETAHQFGTPITSLMGWIDYLKENPAEGKQRPDMDKIIEFMTTDLNQLKNIASRFGKVGSQTKLAPVELHSILVEIVEYFRTRMPHLGSRIDIHLISKLEGVKVLLDVELFKWTLENLIKNCVDAMSTKGGNIIITATHKDKWINLHVRDEGKGIPRSQWKKIFEPGVTSKARGWGLGLSLAKRIIEEYHQGQIRVLESAVGEGSTFEIRLHVDVPKKEKL
jgi:signal transduction histidine kinase